MTKMKIGRKQGISFVCAECGAILFHVDARSGKDQFLPQPSEFVAKHKYCPKCGHKLKEPLDANAVKIAGAAFVLRDDQRLHEIQEKVAA
jgi:predicted RNA-binding Zn-ribbon protein involved in translation (DUF1610 family)